MFLTVHNKEIIILEKIFTNNISNDLTTMPVGNSIKGLD